jgi:hypothetical protein
MFTDIEWKDKAANYYHRKMLEYLVWAGGDDDDDCHGDDDA